ncbi:hypothetical protein EJ03DRAFT_153342 [Teratosphaeria nubilosa]|uniref:Uncharacterized protein n=1 Tax=Teratosphaeria nubilosa TaxID=161662 RepID=A0A6G1LJH2_9PEZI|nr:hypothetical protein EJ03DRAFT_153342 [Teratosphaeria nubilosa]
MHITNVFIALCAATALAAPPHAKLNGRSSISRRSAFPNPYAEGPEDVDGPKKKLGNKGKGGSSSKACPAWTYTKYNDADCEETPETPVSDNKPMDCTPYKAPAEGEQNGFTFDDQGVWELHVYTSEDCTTSGGAKEGFIPKENSVDGMCYVTGGLDEITHSIEIVLKDDADCTPGQ